MLALMYSHGVHESEVVSLALPDLVLPAADLRVGGDGRVHR